MKISVITVCYNSARYIEETIKSIMYQSYKNFEYIIVDGGSTDGTIDVVKSYEYKFDGRLKWNTGRDEGIYDAMNKGIAMSTGDVIGILNSDDYYMNKFVLEKVVLAFEQSVCEFIYGGILMISPKSGDIVRKWRPGEYGRSKMKYGWCPPHTAVFASRRLYDIYGYYDSSFKISGDMDWMLRVLYNNNIKPYYLKDYVVKMRAGGVSTIPVSFFVKRIEDLRCYRNAGLTYFSSCFACFCKVMRKFDQIRFNLFKAKRRG